MAKHLDLEEQEQLAELKHFWRQYGDLITWVLIAVFGTVAAWNGYQYWQGRQSSQASVMYDEVDRAVLSGDTARVERSLGDRPGFWRPKPIMKKAISMLQRRHSPG